VYDALQKEGATSSRDRRTALELAVIVESLARNQSSIRWVPHSRMPVDALTKADVGKSNAALDELIKSGMMSLVDEKVEMEARQGGLRNLSRSHAASQQLLSAESRPFKAAESGTSCPGTHVPPVLHVSALNAMEERKSAAEWCPLPGAYHEARPVREANLNSSSYIDIRFPRLESVEVPIRGPPEHKP